MNDAKQPILLLQLLRIALRLLRPDGVIYSGETVREYYGQFFDQALPWMICRPAVDLALIEIQPQDVPPPARTSGTGHRVVLVGNINPTKGTVQAIRVVRSLIAEGFDITLEIVGAAKSSQAGYLAACEREAGTEWGERIVHRGVVDDPIPYFLHSDLVLCTSLHEAGPLVVFEAALLGCPIATTDVGDVAHVLNSYPSSLISDPGDEDALKNNIRELLELSKRATAHERRLAAQHVSADVTAVELAKFYRSLSG